VDRFLPGQVIVAKSADDAVVVVHEARVFRECFFQRNCTILKAISRTFVTRLERQRKHGGRYSIRSALAKGCDTFEAISDLRAQGR
jgi:hypothetical protein